jgi:hypothetical protein
LRQKSPRSATESPATAREKRLAQSENYKFLISFRREEHYMIVKEYSFIEPQGAFGKEFGQWIRKHPIAAERLLTALETLVRRDLEFACLATATDPGGIEIYLVPSAQSLSVVAGPAFLVRFDHGFRTYEMVDLIDDYGGVGERQQWRAICARALGLL